MCACNEHLLIDAFEKKETNKHPQSNLQKSTHAHTHIHASEAEQWFPNGNEIVMRIFVKNIMIWKRKFCWETVEINGKQNVWIEKHTHTFRQILSNIPTKTTKQLTFNMILSICRFAKSFRTYQNTRWYKRKTERMPTIQHRIGNKETINSKYIRVLFSFLCILT